jgi:hypothetical protein
MRIYVHKLGQYDAEAVETEAHAVLAAALEVEDGEAVLLEDAEDVLDVDLSFADAGVSDRAHVFKGGPKRVEVEVNFNGELRTNQFSASTRIAGVFKWAVGKHGFDLSDEDAAEHALALSNGTMPPSDTHVGSLDDATPGHLRLALVPKHRYEG